MFKLSPSTVVRARLLSLLLAMSALCAPAMAQTITFVVEAELTQVDPELAGQFSVGDVVVGSYTFDVVPNVPSGDYSFSIQTAEFDVGSYSMTNQGPGNIFVTQSTGPGFFDRYAVGILAQGAPIAAPGGQSFAPRSIEMAIEDHDSTALDSNDLLLEPPVLGLYERREIAFRFAETSNQFIQKTTAGVVLSMTRLPSGPTTVQVDVGTYPGNWSIVGQTGLLSGSQALVLGAGSYEMKVGALNQAQGGTFTFDVSEFGDVTVANGVSATGGIAVLDFVTTPVAVSTHAYGGEWGFARVNFATVGDATLDLVPAIRYAVQIGRVPLALGGAVLVDVQANGDVVSLEPAALVGGPGTLDFVTRGVAVDTGPYGGEWGFRGVNFATTGDATVDLVPLVPYDLQVGELPPSAGGGLRVTVDELGTVTSDNPDAAAGGVQRLDFQTAAIVVDVGQFSGQWGFGRVNFSTTGDLSVDLVTNLRYNLRIGGLTVALGGGTEVEVSSLGGVTLANSELGAGGAGSLSLATFPIDVDPGGFAGGWSIDRVFGGSGVQTVSLVPGVTYELAASPDQGQFTVSSPCSVDPSQLTLAGELFELGCGSLDLDGDGVPDAIDNCVQDPNPGQVDQDFDGVGDVCDPDLDGDGVPNTADNCPDLSNPSQADLDGDGLGDECDSDVDGDSVADAVDNCPLTPNTDQADNDGDGAGDPCDIDDDNDGIADSSDNCALVANPDQQDSDGDGFGDLCDGDVDGDGVANGSDLCPGSPSGTPIDAANGCTGAQRVALECVRANFSNKGRYVSCVAQSASAAVADGLLTQQERARIVRDAARGN